MTAEVAEHHTEPWTPDVSTFGARLALVRQRMGWGNVKEAAEQCGLPAENWRRWERDGIEPRRLTTIAMAIATRTGCDYLWLVHGPDRGAIRTSERYFGSHVVTSVGDTRHYAKRSTRPVRQTRPIGRILTRPLTPVAQ